MKFFLLINVKMPTIVGILTFMSSIVGIITFMTRKNSIMPTILLINVKMQTIVGILTFMVLTFMSRIVGILKFMSRINSILGHLSLKKKPNFLIFLYLGAFNISCSTELSI